MSRPQREYFKITFDAGAGSIGQGQHAEVQARFNKTDWSNYDRSNDYSYAPYSSYTQWDKATVYVNGQLVWGYEPGMVGPLKTTVIAENTEEFSEKTVYNYPNPCRDKTTIRFPLKERQNVRVVISDIKGKVIWSRDIPEAEARAGNNFVVWQVCDINGRPAANGIYIMRVITKAGIVVKKIAVIR